MKACINCVECFKVLLSESIVFFRQILNISTIDLLGPGQYSQLVFNRVNRKIFRAQQWLTII